jgi:hypothetical protein
LIEKRLGDWCGTAGFNDDVSLLAVEILEGE